MRLRAMRRLPTAHGRLVHTELETAISDSYARPALRRAIRRDGGKVCLGIDPAHTLAATDRLGDFHKPVLLAWAADDLLFPVTLAQRLAAVLPDATLVTIADSRTFISEDRPDELAAAISAFLTDTASHHTSAPTQ